MLRLDALSRSRHLGMSGSPPSPCSTRDWPGFLQTISIQSLLSLPSIQALSFRCLHNSGASARKWTTPLNAVGWIPPETTPVMPLSSSLPLNPPPTNSPQAPTTTRHAGAPAGPFRRPTHQSAPIRGRAASPAQKARTSWLWTRKSTGARLAGIAGVAVPVRYRTRT